MRHICLICILLFSITLNLFSQSKGKEVLVLALKTAEVNDFETAIKYNFKGIEEFKKENDSVGVLNCYANLYGCYMMLDRGKNFFSHEKAFLPYLKKTSDMSIYVALDIGHLYKLWGNFKKAEYYFNIASQNVKKLKVQNQRLNATINITKAAYLFETGDVDNAENYLKQSIREFLSIPKDSVNPDEIVTSYLRLKNIYDKKKNYAASKIATLNALKYAKSPYSLSAINNQLADFYLLQKNDSAFIFINKAIAIQKANSYTNKLVYSKKQLGEYYLNKKDLLGKKVLDEALLLAKEQNQKENISKIYELLAKFAQNEADFEHSLNFIQAGIGTLCNNLEQKHWNSSPKISQINYKNQILPLLKTKIDILKSYYLRQNSRAVLESIISTAKTFDEIIDYQRISFQSEDSRMFLNESAHQIYAEAIESLFLLFNQTKDSKYVSQAFHFIEKSKSVVLNQALKMGKKQYFRGVSNELIDQEYELYKKINFYEFQLNSDKKNENHLAEIRKLMLETTEQLTQLKELFKTQYPAYFKYKYDINSGRISEIQSGIDAETAMINYFLDEKTIYIIGFDKQKVVFSKIVKTDTFEGNFKNLVDIIYKKPAFGNYKGSTYAQYTYNQLLKPVGSCIANKKRLIILRDAELNFLPFEVLEETANRYLIHDFAISYAYSATIWYNAVQEKIRDDKSSLLAFAPYTSNATIKNNFRDASLKPLPASENEVSKIGGTIYKANTATKNKFLEDYRKHGIIHFATHAQVDDVNPDKSFIAFFPESTDYKLFTNDLYLLNLQNTRLVVLSACEAGRGKFQNGEGLMSLARGFAYAGCPSVVTTLWNAHDESMAFLSERLHNHLQADLPIDIALQKAKLDYFNSSIGKELDHPYYWANFILIGNNNPVFEENKTTWWLWGMACLIGLAGLYWLYQRRK